MADARMPSDDRLAPLIDAALHRYFSNLTRRYVPVVVGLAVIALIAVALPSRQHTTANVASSSDDKTGEAAATPTNDAASTVTTAAAATVAAGATSGVSSLSTGARGAANTSSHASGVEASVSGVAKSGVHCGKGVLQVTWTPYAPPCVAAFTGKNGGATAPGVTADTITVTLRGTNDGNASGFYPPFADRVADLNVMIDWFNKNYEFYGRHIVLKAYTGQGSTLQELQGQGQAGAQADAQTEKDMGSFANVGDGFFVFGSALADQSIMLMGDGFSGENIYQQYSPFIYGSAAEASADDFGRAAAETVCQRMKGMPAKFAGEADYVTKTRTFGLVAIQQPDMKPAGDAFERDAKACGVTPKRADYSFDVPNEPQQAAQIVVQMKSANITTLVSAADPLMFAQLTLAAERADWHPEYVTLDPLGLERNGDANQTIHAIKVSNFGSFPGAGPNVEAGRVFRIATGGAAPRTGGFDFVEAYMQLLTFATAVQAAGPNLTPNTFIAAKAALPDARGDFGLWRSSQKWDVIADFVVSHFDPNATDPNDGEAGTWKNCNGGTRYLNRGAQMGSGQLNC